MTTDRSDYKFKVISKEVIMDKQMYKDLWAEEMFEKTKYKSQIEKIIKLIKDEPNDMRLGSLVRALHLDDRDLSSHDDDWRIEQYNRNRALKDQISSIEELDGEIENFKKKLSEEIVEEESIKVKKYIYESPDGGKTVYRRECGDGNSPDSYVREKINWEEEKERMKDTWDDPFSQKSS